MTIQGTARLDRDGASCIVLGDQQRSASRSQFTDYKLGNDGAPAIVATDDDGRVLAHDGDTVVVTGRDDRRAPTVWRRLHRREPELGHPRS